MYRKIVSASMFVVLSLFGCNNSVNVTVQAVKLDSEKAPGNYLVVPLFISEYPSWGGFATATDMGLIDGRPGWVGPIEKKYGVDLDVRSRPYDTCISEFGSVGGAICVTNVDLPGIYKNRHATAILPTSTSAGADAVTVIGVEDLDDLVKVDVYGLEKSVSDFAFTRILEENGRNPDNYKFRNRDPEATATGLQSGSIKAGMIWNPFVILTLQTQPKAKVLIDTKAIPGEVIDMVAFDDATLANPKGNAAAQCVVETYYAVCDLLNDKMKGDDAYESLKERFAPKLTVEQMRSICEVGPGLGGGYKTHFYASPEEGIQVFEQDHLEPIMKKVLKWANDRQLVEGDMRFMNRKTFKKMSLTGGPPTIVFDETFMQAAGK